MNARLSEWYELARSSFWFLPTLMMAAGAVLFGATLAVDTFEPFGRDFTRIVYSGGAQNAANLLQTLTAAMVAIATVVFSTLMLVLTLATSQFGHRLIRSFMRDRFNQAVLGIFLSTFVYCMLVFHMLGNDPGNHFVPGFSISVGFVLALFATCTLIYFTHHIAELIAAPEVLEAVAGELDGAIDRLYPPADDDSDQKQTADAARPPELDDCRATICADSGGYIQTVARQALVGWAREHDVVIESAVGFGDYVLPGGVLARVHGAALNHETLHEAATHYVLGNIRLTNHDLLFATNQVAEIAVRALSPALNDPFTAVDCINRMGRSLARLASRPLPSECHHDDNDDLRLVFVLPGFDDMLDAAFTPMRNYGRSSVMTDREMLKVIAKLAPLTEREHERDALRRHADVVRAAAGNALSEQSDIDRIERHYRHARSALGIGPDPPTTPT